MLKSDCTEEANRTGFLSHSVHLKTEFEQSSEIKLLMNRDVERSLQSVRTECDALVTECKNYGHHCLVDVKASGAYGNQLKENLVCDDACVSG
jgi:hypothetical protein